MTRYPLQSVLDLRRREEDAAHTALANATRSLRAAEKEEAGLVELVELARTRLAEARANDGTDDFRGGVTATFGMALFEERRRAELGRAETALSLFRREVLAAAQAAERATRASTTTARRKREALEKHAAKHAAAARLTDERRAEETIEEVARAARHAHTKRRD